MIHQVEAVSHWSDSGHLGPVFPSPINVVMSALCFQNWFLTRKL